MCFLAGYADGDGSLGIYPYENKHSKRKCVIRKVSIGSEDVGILKDVKEKLTEYGYHPLFYLARKKCKHIIGFGPYNRDLWFLHIDRKNEVLDLLNYPELKLRGFSLFKPRTP